MSLVSRPRRQADLFRGPARVLAVSLALILALTGVLPARAAAQEQPPSTGTQDQPPPPEAPLPVPPPELRVVHVTDTHWIAGASNEGTRAVLAEVAALDPRPDLLIHGGDLAEMGREIEYKEMKAALDELDLPYRAVPGNHDARWLDAGKAGFRRAFGPPYQSFDLGGVHFILLDSTIDAGTHGHFDAPLLEWLKADLEKTGRDRPVVIFFHHPVAYTPLAFTDTDDELLQVLRPYNVRAVLTGHGHLHMAWQRNGIPFFMTAAGDERGYKVLDFAAGTLRVYDGSAGQPLRLVAQIPLTRPDTTPELRLGGVSLAGRSLRFTVQARDLPPDAQGWYRIDLGPWQALPPFDGSPVTVDLSDLPPGTHRLRIWAAPAGAALPGSPATARQWELRNLGPSWSDFSLFESPGAQAGVAASARSLWQHPTPGGIQAAPAVDSGSVYVADLSGRIAALDLATGTVRWQFQARDAILGSPALAQGLVLAGDRAGWLHALDAATGLPRWERDLGAPLLAEPLVALGLVYIGDARGRLHALDLASGEERWQYEAGALIRARATYGAGHIYVGAWDRTVHAVDALSGRLAWKRELPGSAYYSPANTPPLYYRGRVFVTRSMPKGEAGLYALDARDGTVLWNAQGGFGYSAPILHGGLVVVSSGDGTVTAFDPLTGEARWRARGGVTTFDGALSSYGGNVVLDGLYGDVVALTPPPVTATGTPAEGSVSWRYSAGPGYLFARPSAGGDRLYVGTLGGLLHAVRAPAAPSLPLTAGSPGLVARTVPDPGFPDARRHWAGESIALARAMGLAAGRPDGRFDPDGSLTRAEMATLLVRYLGLPQAPEGTPSRLADIQGHWAAGAIRSLEARGLVSGVQVGNKLRFEPDRSVTRAEVATLLARILGREHPSGSTPSRFMDLTRHWAGEAVRALEELGIVSGHTGPGGAPIFLPDRAVTRAEAVTLLVRVALP